jgi:hypothetical protein
VTTASVLPPKPKGQGEAIGSWLLLENAHNSNLLGDVAGVDNCEEAAKDPSRCGKELFAVSELFCDNIMLFALVPDNRCWEQRKGHLLVKQAYVEALNASVAAALKVNNLPVRGGGVKAKPPF